MLTKKSGRRLRAYALTDFFVCRQDTSSEGGVRVWWCVCGGAGIGRRDEWECAPSVRSGTSYASRLERGGG